MDMESLHREVQDFSRWTKLYNIKEAAVLWIGQGTTAYQLVRQINMISYWQSRSP
jgi:hypothetical protein